VLVYSGNSLHLGHAVVLMDKWDAEKSLELIERYRVTTSHMVPTQFHRMLLLPEAVRAKYDMSSTRCMIHAAAPCPPDVKRRMIEWWGHSVYEYYAATEGGGTLVTPQEWMKYPGTVGKAVAQRRDPDHRRRGQRRAHREQGTVYMKLGETGKFEYKGDEQKTKKNRIVKDDTLYFTVGDVGYLNGDGYLFLCDRKIDMIISGGANIYPAEIENVFLEHPKVGDVAVFGIPHEEWGEEIKAVVEPVPGAIAGEALAAELLAFCRERLAKFKLPKTIDFQASLPRDPNGKLYKRRAPRSLLGGQGARDLRRLALAALALLVIAWAALAVFGERLMNRIEPGALPVVTARAVELHHSSAVVDLHADSLLFGRDLTRSADVGHTDLPRLREGGVALQVFGAADVGARGHPGGVLPARAEHRSQRAARLRPDRVRLLCEARTRLPRRTRPRGSPRRRNGSRS
jgi:hypothetical protein